jgi:hypothetical protein
MMSPEILQLFAIVYTHKMMSKHPCWMTKAYVREVPRAIFAPVTHRVQDGASSRVQRTRHVRVSFVRDVGRAGKTFVVTVVVFFSERQYALENQDKQRCKTDSDSRRPNWRRSGHQSLHDLASQIARRRCTFRRRCRCRTKVQRN